MLHYKVIGRSYYFGSNKALALSSSNIDKDIQVLIRRSFECSVSYNQGVVIEMNIFGLGIKTSVEISFS